MRITPPKEDGPLLYPAEPGPSGEQIPGPAPILESAPVILDPQTQPAIREGERDLDAGGGRVLDDVPEGFLRDPKRRGLHEGIQSRFAEFKLEVHRKPSWLQLVMNVPAERGGEP